MNELPLYHFRHLKKLAALRRITAEEAVQYLTRHIAPTEQTWIRNRFGETAETRTLDMGGCDPKDVIKRIEALPRQINPVTDGPYLKDFRFLADRHGLIGIETEVVRIYDFELETPRDAEVLALVRDLLPTMSVAQFRVYNFFNSQYLRLTREPELFTMPTTAHPAVDAGCYVGYKALALAGFTRGAPVLAFEIAEKSFEVLELNITQNPRLNVRPIRAALSDKRSTLPVHIADPRSMVVSLTDLHSLDEHGQRLLYGEGTGALSHKAPTDKTDKTDIIETALLDDYTADIERISAVHVSVNGHEPEVVRGATETLHKADVIRVSCPFRRDGVSIESLVVQQLQNDNIPIFGKSGGAIVAGKTRGDYHAVPLNDAGEFPKRRSLLERLMGKR